MKKGKSTPWSYRKGSSPLYRLPAGFKLVFLLLLSLAAFVPGTPLQSLVLLSGITVIVIILSFIAGSGPIALLRGSFPLFIFILAVFLFQGIQFSPPGIRPEGLFESVIFCIRIAIAFASGSLLFAVTTPGEIRRSLSRAETFLHIQKLRLSLSISLMLGFLPMFFVIWEDVNLAWDSRGGKKNISRLVVLIPIVVERLMVKAAETAMALEARGI